VIQLVEAPIRRMFFQTRPSKADYVAMIVKRFELADPDHEGKLDAKELETEDGQALVKLLHQGPHQRRHACAPLRRRASGDLRGSRPSCWKHVFDMTG
jgi:hypothetical protein